MLDLEQLGSAAMEIIAYAGVAKSNYVEAARLARAYRFDEATALIDEGDAVMKNAHDCASGTLTERGAGEYTTGVHAHPACRGSVHEQ